MILTGKCWTVSRFLLFNTGESTHSGGGRQDKDRGEKERKRKRKKGSGDDEGSNWVKWCKLLMWLHDLFGKSVFNLALFSKHSES